MTTMTTRTTVVTVVIANRQGIPTQKRMLMSPASDRFVYLRGGLTVPVEPLQLMFDLQERGFRLQADGDNALIVQPAQLLTGEDRRQIRRWKLHVLALLDY